MSIGNIFQVGSSYAASAAAGLANRSKKSANAGSKNNMSLDVLRNILNDMYPLLLEVREAILDQDSAFDVACNQFGGVIEKVRDEVLAKYGITVEKFDAFVGDVDNQEIAAMTFEFQELQTSFFMGKTRQPFYTPPDWLTPELVLKIDAAIKEGMPQAYREVFERLQKDTGRVQLRKSQKILKLSDEATSLCNSLWAALEASVWATEVPSHPTEGRQFHFAAQHYMDPKPLENGAQDDGFLMKVMATITAMEAKSEEVQQEVIASLEALGVEAEEALQGSAAASLMEALCAEVYPRLKSEFNGVQSLFRLCSSMEEEDVEAFIMPKLRPLIQQAEIEAVEKLGKGKGKLIMDVMTDLGADDKTDEEYAAAFVEYRDMVVSFLSGKALTKPFLTPLANKQDCLVASAALKKAKVNNFDLLYSKVGSLIGEVVYDSASNQEVLHITANASDVLRGLSLEVERLFFENEKNKKVFPNGREDLDLAANRFRIRDDMFELQWTSLEQQQDDLVAQKLREIAKRLKDAKGQ